MKIPSIMTCEAHAKGYNPVSKLWLEVCGICRCTRAQFSDAMSDTPSDYPSVMRVRRIAREILDKAPEVQKDSFRLKCAGVGKEIKDIYNIYIAENPDHTICYERFRLAASEPYTSGEYRIAKAADEIIDRLKEEQTNEQAE